jgi:hypothetical protein
VQELEDKLAAAIEATQQATYRQSGPMQGVATIKIELDVELGSGTVAKVTATVPCRLIDESGRIEFSLN